jgi:hypothetical protein
VDGVNVGPENTTAPYGVTWDTRAGANGSHTLTAVARDAAGNTATSAGITVTVANTAAGPVATASTRVPGRWPGIRRARATTERS